ncbi:IS66 family transposase [Bacteroidia bacterium]|nr:IS66 family transposase [Bacteroidia bacterium]
MVVMAFADDENDTFIQALLQERDHLYRETAKLREEIKGYSDVITLKNSYEQTITDQEGTINKQAEKINSLEQQVQQLLRKIWGKSSERYIAPDPLQRRIDFEGLDLLPEEEEAAREAQKEVVEYKQVQVIAKGKKKPVRESLPPELPRREEHIYPAGIDLACGKWTELSPEIREMLEHEPSRFYVRRIIRHKYVWNDKSTPTDTPVVTASLPALALAKSYASSSLLSELMVNKYVNHLPFYRQIQMFKQLGVVIPASTLNDWFKETADLLRPLYYRLREEVLSTDYIQVDESTIPVVHEEKHKTVKGYIWMVRTVMEKTVFFHYDQGSRAQKVVVGLLKNYQGALQTDGYEVYSIYENKQGVLPLGCWAHARRKFEEALKEDELRAGYALKQIGLLYDVERRADQENLSYETRAELRSRLSYPIMRAFEKWIVKEYPKVLPKGRIGKALSYTYKIYHRLSRYHLDGRYCIDNNLGENTIRPIALGRKNYLFCGNHSAAEDAAVIYSLFGCCKEAGVNFRQWLVYVLDNIHSFDNDYSKDLAELLPKHWKTQIEANPKVQ